MPAEASDAVKEDPVDLWAYIFEFGCGLWEARVVGY